FLAHARRFGDALADGKVLAPAKSVTEMSRIVFNDYVDATLAAVFVAVVLSIVVFGVISIRRALGTAAPTAVEIEFAGAAVAGAGGRHVNHSHAKGGECAHGAADGRHPRLSDLCRAPPHEPSGRADNDLRGVLRRTPGGALRGRQGPLPGLLL